jgi:hypothetical protein
MDQFGIYSFDLTPQSGTFIPGSGISVNVSGEVSGGYPGSLYSWTISFGDGESYQSSGIDMLYCTTNHYYFNYTYYNVSLSVLNSGVNRYTYKILYIYSYPFVFISGYQTSGECPCKISMYAIAQSGIPPYTYTYYFGDNETLVTNTNYTSHQYLYSNSYNPVVVLKDSYGTEVSGSFNLLIYKPNVTKQAEQAENYITKLYNINNVILYFKNNTINDIYRILSLSGSYREDFYRNYPSGGNITLEVASGIDSFSGCIQYIDDNNPSGIW